MTNWRVTNRVFGRFDLKPLGPFLILLPIIGLLVCGLVGYPFATRREYAAYEPAAIVTLGFVFTLVSLLGLWVGIGRTRWPVRVTGVVVAYTAFSVITRICFGGTQFVGFVALEQIGGILAGLRLLRLLHFRMDFRPAGQSGPKLTSPPHRRPLTILDLVLWVMASAVLFTEARTRPFEYDPLVFFWEHSLLLASVALCFSLVAISAVWAALGTAPAGWRIALVSVFAPASGVLLWSIFETGGGALWWAAVTGIQGPCLAAALGIFRVYGYRLCREPDNDPVGGDTAPGS